MSEAVLTSTREPLARKGWSPFATWPVLCVAGVVTLVHLVSSPFGGYWIDEAYMLAAGEFHPDWGYVDQPPLVPLLAAAMDWIAPGVFPVLRLPAVAATAAAVVVAALIARELGGDRRAQVVTAAAYATGLWVNLVGHWLAPYTVEPLLWLLLTWILIRWIRLRDEHRPDDRLLLAFGALLGLTLQTKVQVVALCVALLISVVVFGPREILRRPMLWAGVLIAAVVAAPTLIWQATHGWPQWQMGAVVASESPLLSGGRIGTAIALVLYAGVAGAALFLAGLWRLLLSAELRAYRFLGASTVLLYGFIVATAGRPYYLLGMYGVALAAGALAFQRRREAKIARSARTWGWVAWPAFLLSAVAAAGMLWYGMNLARLIGFPADESIVTQSANAYHALPTDTREHTALVGDTYIVAALLDVYAERHGLPHAYSPHRGYGYFGPPNEQAHSVLYVGDAPDAVRPYFKEVRRVGTGPWQVWFCGGRQGTWSEIWPKLQHL